MAAPDAAPSPTWRPTVTALVPTYNGAAFIEDTLRSLAEQTWPALEILIGEDHSTDDTLDVVHRFAAGRDDVRILARDTNLGWLRNTNDLMAQASGELMFFAFHDDTVAPTYVEQLVEALRDNPGAVLAHSDMEVVALDGRRSTQVFDGFADRPGPLRRGLRMTRFPPGWWVPNRGLFRAAAYGRIGGIHPNERGELSADWTWLLHLALLGEFVRVPEVLCEKRYQPGSISRAAHWQLTPARVAALRRAAEAEIRGSSSHALQKAVLVASLKGRRAAARLRRARRQDPSGR